MQHFAVDIEHGDNGRLVIYIPWVSHSFVELTSIIKIISHLFQFISHHIAYIHLGWSRGRLRFLCRNNEVTACLHLVHTTSSSSRPLLTVFVCDVDNTDDRPCSSQIHGVYVAIPLILSIGPKGCATLHSY